MIATGWPLVPANLTIDSDGVPHNQDYDDVYFSRGGGLDETRYVFIDGNDLPNRFASASDAFEILEIGFGTGLNFLAAWAAFEQHAPANARMNFIAVEKHPLSAEQLTRLHRALPQLTEKASALVTAWPDRIPGFHRRHFAEGRVSLTLLFGDVADVLPELQGGFDVLFLDGFAPSRNPEMWSELVFEQLKRLARPGATVATYSSARIVRDGLVAAGFVVDKRPGFGHKRHMLVGRNATADHANLVSKRPSRPLRPSTVAVIGAGIAGVATAFALARRGVRVQLFERAPAPATGGSGNPAGIVSPVMSRDWNALSQLTGPAIGYVQSSVAERRAAGCDIQAEFNGVLRLARQTRHAARQAGIAAALTPPPSFARWVSSDEVESLVHLPQSDSAQPGWHFPGGGWLAPRTLISAWLTHPLIEPHWDAEIARLASEDHGWVGLGAGGQHLFAVDAVVVAVAEEAEKLVPGVAGLIEPCRGQISLVDAAMLKAGDRLPPLPVTREGYLLGPVGGKLLFGASFKPGDATHDVREAEHEENRGRLAAIDQGLADSLPPIAAWSGRVSLRATTSDRLPLVGPAPAESPEEPAAVSPGLYVNVGHGARGLTWGALLGEDLAAHICGETRPLPRSLTMHLHPTRFRQRQARKN